MTYRKIVFTASSITFNALKCSTSSNNTQPWSPCVFVCSILFSGHISMSSLMGINCSILIMSMGYIVQNVILILEMHFTLHSSLCDFGWTSDFEISNAQANTFHYHISENLTVSTFCSGVVFQNVHINLWRRIKTILPFAGIIRRLPYCTRFQDKG